MRIFWMASTFPRGIANLMSAGNQTRLKSFGSSGWYCTRENAIAFIHEVDTNPNFKKFNLGSALSWLCFYGVYGTASMMMKRQRCTHWKRREQQFITQWILWVVSLCYSSAALPLLPLTSLNSSGLNWWTAWSLRPLFSAPYLWLLVPNSQRAWWEDYKGW